MELVPPFLQHGAGDVDEGWDWGQTIDKYRAAPASQELQRRTSSFKTFMNKTLKESNDKTSQEAFYGKHSWTDVQKEASEALALYKEKGRSWRHPFRSAGRVFSDSAYRMDFLLQLLPNGEYTSLLTGCFNLVYNAAKRFKSLRETVFGVFDSLSETIECSKSYIRIYSEDSELRTKSEALFIAILEAVEAITGWIKRNPGLEAFKSFFQQDAYGSQLEGKITTNIQEKATAFDDRVRACLHTRIRGIDIGVTAMGKDVKLLTKSVSHLSANVLSIKASVEAKPEKQELAMERLEDLLMGIAKEAECQCVKSHFAMLRAYFHLQWQGHM
ncbi:uncharacterized protein LDX57_012659 [Aspergillus melleus]|uniref:uncharacterized protein n=1 Tax=Aspergillus melleus TaxID=138277 RepID=UPI001E8E7F24|nr:uncharacterized protein LDX57_012659 [Aspergillus melleus]KAH8435030.1 hypothetical protein LDX57_012659 [Aspergillus melleus]